MIAIFVEFIDQLLKIIQLIVPALASYYNLVNYFTVFKLITTLCA